MASVVVIFRVYPEDDQLEGAISGIKSAMNPNQIETEEIAFGIKLIKVMFKFDDASNTSSNLEEQLRKIAGVKEVEVAEETLL